MANILRKVTVTTTMHRAFSASTQHARLAFALAALAASALTACTERSAHAAARGTGDAAAAQHDSAAYPVVRALYVNRWTAQSSRKMQKLFAIADSSEINGLVIDMKDEFGLNFRTKNAKFLKYAGTRSYVHDVSALLDSVKAHGLIPIARVVTFKDPVTAAANPDWTIRQPDGTTWMDKEQLPWVNPYNRDLWEYDLGVAVELGQLGFEEIQFDYIRFPEPYQSLPKQVFPGATTSKPTVLAEFLRTARERLNAIGVRTTADVFGFVATVHGPLEVGQEWEKLTPVTDVLLPMVYPSHFPHGSLGVERPNADPYRIIKISLDTARVRDAKLGIVKAEHVRPWLQAFTLGKMQPPYGPDQLKEQKRAAYDAGYQGWVLWNPGSNYESFVPGLAPRSERPATNLVAAVAQQSTRPVTATADSFGPLRADSITDSLPPPRPRR
jgi:hypothetical protein